MLNRLGTEQESASRRCSWHTEFGLLRQQSSVRTATINDDETKSEDGIKYTVFLDHDTFAELRERAAKHNCSVGAELRHIAKNAIAASRAKQQQ
jgi:hypothetical protein